MVKHKGETRYCSTVTQNADVFEFNDTFYFLTYSNTYRTCHKEEAESSGLALIHFCILNKTQRGIRIGFQCAKVAASKPTEAFATNINDRILALRKVSMS